MENSNIEGPPSSDTESWTRVSLYETRSERATERPFDEILRYALLLSLLFVAGVSLLAYIATDITNAAIIAGELLPVSLLSSSQLLLIRLLLVLLWLLL